MVLISKIFSFFMILAMQVSAATDIALANEKFKQVNEQYAANSNFSMNVTYNMYAKYTAAQPEYTYQGYFKKQQNNYHSSLLGIETIQNNEYRIVIDTTEKIIAITDPEKNTQTTSVDLEKSLSLCSNISYSEASGGEQIFTLNFDKSSAIEYASIQINVAKENYIKKIVFYFKNEVSLNEEDENSPKNKPKVEIIYSDFKTKLSIAKDELSEKKYIAFKDGKLFPAKQYANYQLVNQKKQLK